MAETDPYVPTEREARSIESRLSALERHLSPGEGRKHHAIESDKLFMAIVESSTALNSDPTTQWSYSCKRAELTSAGYGGWQAMENVDAITAYSTGEEVEGSSGSAIPDGTPVLIRKQVVKGAGLQYQIVGAISGGVLPDGTGQYKVLQLDADDSPHWDWPRLHA